MASGGGVTSEMVLVVSWHGPDSCPWVCCSAHSWANLTCSNWPTAPAPCLWDWRGCQVPHLAAPSLSSTSTLWVLGNGSGDGNGTCC